VQEKRTQTHPGATWLLVPGLLLSSWLRAAYAEAECQLVQGRSVLVTREAKV
jgi:hypothetical protein